jgi:hypothetical protein
VEYDDAFFSWSECEEFWILRSPDYYELHITLKNRLKSDLIIQTGEADPYTLRDTLSQYLPQTIKKREKILDAIIRFCKL